MQMVHRSAGAIVFRRERDRILYLVLHYEAGHWEFPKGHIEKGESTEQAVLRETQEETGISDLKFVPGFKKTIKYFLWPRKGEKGRPAPKFVVFYIAETKTKDVTLSFEHKGYEWLPYEEALERVTYKNSKEVLREANAFLTKQKM